MRKDKAVDAAVQLRAVQDCDNPGVAVFATKSRSLCRTE